MQVSFDPTPDDYEYIWHRVAERLRRTSPVLRRARRRQLILMPLVGAALFFVIFTGRSLQSRLVAAALGAVGGVLLSIPWPRRRPGRLLRRFVRELHSASASPFTVELTDVAVVTSAPSGDAVVPWSNVESIEDGERSIDFWTHDGGMIAVQKRAFANTAEADDFFEHARALHAECGSCPEDD